jgi:hypothetical protein
MTRRWLMAMGFAFLFGGRLVMSQTTGPTTVTLPGAYLKWLHIAETEIRRKNLDADNYVVTVVVREETATVIFKSADAPEGAKGSGGSHAGYEVEIKKKDSKVVRSNYVR